ncbi:MAG: hypothetical protein JST28_19525 [Acidobacteria bacterium]|nr:hypothetical protein [Acidobacteriota bacterium]
MDRDAGVRTSLLPFRVAGNFNGTWYSVDAMGAIVAETPVVLLSPDPEL